MARFVLFFFEFYSVVACPANYHVIYLHTAVAGPKLMPKTCSSPARCYVVVGKRGGQEPGEPGWPGRGGFVFYLGSIAHMVSRHCALVQSHSSKNYTPSVTQIPPA